ncbi:hypothetical protein WR25_18429 isoform K [Diploscapter pachys]|uniref:Uncharacterized protein n=1 Tax=Diploscapter pachys TaxID=2018661 RepID=A0A2A2KTB9_9BILA|nr:hypothetical protein WR25_18429 isoform K [Diploscapter pachys]
MHKSHESSQSLDHYYRVRSMFDRQLAEHMDVEDEHSDRSRNRRRHKDRDERSGRKNEDMRELVALADQRLVEIARIYEVDAQALRHQYVLSSLYVSAPNNNSRRYYLHNGPTTPAATAKGHQNENEQNSSNPHKHNSKEQSKETSKIDVPEGDLLGLRLEMGCLEEEIKRELEMERDGNADRDKQVDEQGCRAVRSFSSDSLMLESASQVGLPCRKKKRNHTGNGYSMQEIQSNKWLRDAYKSSIEMKLLIAKQQMQLHVQVEDRSARAEKERDETEMEGGKLHGIQTRDEDTDVVAKKVRETQ